MGLGIDLSMADGAKTSSSTKLNNENLVKLRKEKPLESLPESDLPIPSNLSLQIDKFSKVSTQTSFGSKKKTPKPVLRLKNHPPTQTSAQVPTSSKLSKTAIPKETSSTSHLSRTHPSLTLVTKPTTNMTSKSDDKEMVIKITRKDVGETFDEKKRTYDISLVGGDEKDQVPIKIQVKFPQLNPIYPPVNKKLHRSLRKPRLTLNRLQLFLI